MDLVIICHAYDRWRVKPCGICHRGHHNGHQQELGSSDRKEVPQGVNNSMPTRCRVVEWVISLMETGHGKTFFQSSYVIFKCVVDFFEGDDLDITILYLTRKTWEFFVFFC